MESIRNSNARKSESSDSPEAPLIDALRHEAVCRIRLPEALHLDSPSYELSSYVLDEGRIKEFNRVFSEEIAAAPQQRVEDSLIAQYVTADFQPILESFFEQNGQLSDKRYCITESDSSTRHFDVAIKGETADNRLSRIVVSFLDVTPRVDLERQLVTSLENQRRQLGRELHDGVSQLLTGIRLLSETLVNTLARDMDRERRLAENILAYARDATDEVSHLEKDLLAGNELMERGLVDSLRRIANSTDTLPSVSCTITSSHEELPFTEDESPWPLHLYRIAQEAVHNAVRHGEPEQIEISLTYHPPRLVLSVRDDGKGFDADQEPSHGLKTMRYRADSIGADLEVESSEGHGTTVTCILSHPQNNS